jgi:hypothetical protein
MGVRANTGGVQDINQQQKLFQLLSANMQSTSDQQFQKLFAGTNFVITKVVAVWASGGTTVACAGGIYTAASKAGSALIGAAQSWINLTASGKIVDATLAALLATDLQSATPYLSLTTGSTAAATADIYIYGVVIS